MNATHTHTPAHSFTPPQLYTKASAQGPDRSLASTGAQQGPSSARLADCAHWGTVEWQRGVDGPEVFGKDSGVNTRVSQTSLAK